MWRSRPAWKGSRSCHTVWSTVYLSQRFLFLLLLLLLLLLGSDDCDGSQSFSNGLWRAINFLNRCRRCWHFVRPLAADRLRTLCCSVLHNLTIQNDLYAVGTFYIFIIGATASSRLSFFPLPFFIVVLCAFSCLQIFFFLWGVCMGNESEEKLLSLSFL